MLEPNSQQSTALTIQNKSAITNRPAGKASGVPAAGENHIFSDQPAPVWKANEPQTKQSDEKSAMAPSTHSNIFPIFPRVAKGALDRKQFTTSRDNMPSPFVPLRDPRYQYLFPGDSQQNKHLMSKHGLQKDDRLMGSSPTNNFSYITGNSNPAAEVEASTFSNTRALNA